MLDFCESYAAQCACPILTHTVEYEINNNNHHPHNNSRIRCISATYQAFSWLD